MSHLTLFLSYAFDLVLLILIVRICLKAFKFIPISILHHWLIPIYCIVVFFLSMKWNEEDLKILLVLLPIAIGIGYFQTTGFRMKAQYNEKKKKMVFLFQRNWPFIIGYALSIGLGIALGIVIRKQSFDQLLINKLVDDALEDLDPLFIFSTTHPWYIWFLTGISSLSFTLFARHKLKLYEKTYLVAQEVKAKATQTKEQDETAGKQSDLQQGQQENTEKTSPALSESSLAAQPKT